MERLQADDELRKKGELALNEIRSKNDVDADWDVKALVDAERPAVRRADFKD